MNSRFFSASYQQARERFRQAATENSAELSSYPIDDHDDLTIDVATVNGPQAAKTIVISSGVHGVEGFFGSAIQLAWLSERMKAADDDTRFVLIHAINPYGFQQIRRWNEDNVDLNRNFHRTPNDYAGTPGRYAQLDSLLNPRCPVGPFELFKIRAICHLMRFGLPAIREAVATGQYEYPRGLFFGGKTACLSTAHRSRQHGIVDRQCQQRGSRGPSQRLGPFC